MATKKKIFVNTNYLEIQFSNLVIFAHYNIKTGLLTFLLVFLSGIMRQFLRERMELLTQLKQKCPRLFEPQLFGVVSSPRGPLNLG